MVTLQMGRGVTHGCELSLLLVNIYSEELFTKEFENCTEEITINGETINNILYGDDTVTIAENENNW